MIETLHSLVDNYKSKIKNPLIGTIISVWVIHNWRIVYAVFNFDDDSMMHDKINFIDDYFSKKDFLVEVGIIVAIAFSVIIITFILLGISRFLTNLYYKIIEPWIRGKVSKHEIFTIEKKEELELDIIGFKEKIEKLKDQNSKSENLNSFLQNRNQEIENKYDKELLELSEKSRIASESYEKVLRKDEKTKKVITYFDDIITSLSPDIKKEIKTYIDYQKDPTGKAHKNFIGLNQTLLNTGIKIESNGNLKNTGLGLLFLDYFKDFNEDLPF